jgi:hypothetical protein
MVVNLFDANFYRAANADLASFNDAQALAHFQSFGLNEGRRFNGLVDLGLYRASNSDLASFNNQQLYDHLSNFGVTEGRKFSAFFDSDFYRANNNDLRSFNNVQLFQHANDFGILEGRRLSAFADLNYYRANNSDLSSFNNKQLLNHLQAFGLNEGRRFSQFIDLNFYKSSNGDLASFDNKQLLNHLASFGINEGRRFNPLVDLNFYRSANSDLAAVGFNNQQLFNHLETFGVAEGRRFSVSYDGNYYRSFYSDLAAVGFNSSQLFEHFQNFGLAEGRASSQSFNVTYYLGNNADLTAAGLNNVAALQHFEIFGLREGRVGEAPISLAANRNDNTLSTAPNLDVLSYNRTFSSQSVGTSDPNDFYRFLLADRSNLNINLRDVTGNTLVQLVQDTNNNGQFEDDEVLFGRTVAATTNGSFELGTLAGGTYYVRIAPENSTTNANYSLSMSADFVPPSFPRNPGASPDNPFNIGNLGNGTVSLRDVVSRTARDDYYQFTITAPTEINVSLTGLRGDADVQIFQGNANAQSSPIYGSYNRGNTPESIRTFLEPGTYTVQVFSNDGSSNNYNLTLATNASTPIEPNNTLGGAFNFGNLTGTSLNLRQVVGATDPEDFYKFSLNRTSQVNLNFNASTVGITIGAKLDLIFDSNSNGVIDEGDRVFADLPSGQINPTLGAGTYFVRIFTDVTPTTTDSNYTISLSATATAAPTLATDPGNSRDATTVANVGTLTAAPRSFNDFVGSADREDYYRFTLSSKANIQLTLDQISDNAYLDLISESGETLFRSYTSPTETTRFGRIPVNNLDAGNYFARVFTNSPTVNTTYRLNLQNFGAS